MWPQIQPLLKNIIDHPVKEAAKLAARATKQVVKETLEREKKEAVQATKEFVD